MKKLLGFASLTILLTGWNAFAKVDVKRVQGASNINQSASTAVIYGGIGGSAANCTEQDDLHTCNSCTTGDLTVCNQRRIYPSLILRITLESDSISGTARAIYDGNEIPSNEPTCTKGSACTLEVQWKDLCDLDEGTSACDLNVSETISVGIDSDVNSTSLEDSTSVSIKVHSPTDPEAPYAADTVDDCESFPSNGICDFNILPGKDIVFLKSPESIGDFPNVEGLNFSHLRLYYSMFGFYDIHNSSSFYEDFRIDLSGEPINIINPFIENLVSLVPYFFRVALVDDAGNVSHFTSNMAIDNEKACNSMDDAESFDSVNCDFVAIPY